MSSFLLQKFWGTLATTESLYRIFPQVNSRWSPPNSHDAHTLAAQDQRTIEEPYIIFQRWLISAQKQAPQVRPRLACMATVDKAGEPVTRLTSIEDVSANGITFFTTLGSRQAGEISQNPHVSLHFNWAPLMRSVRIAGTAYKLTDAQAIDQFRRYSRHMQLSITHGPRYAARYSQARSGFFQRIVERLSSWFGKVPEEIPMPTNWGGFLLAPSLFEFGMMGEQQGRKRLRFRRCLNLPRGARGGTVQAETQDWVYDSSEE
ncbi:hypothetical protein KR074_011571 [Drosophila pseudoananassae]|nr:hypothetical protein KR074_011571 [Drosophila pseudoananassae]